MLPRRWHWEGAYGTKKQYGTVQCRKEFPGEERTESASPEMALGREHTELNIGGVAYEH